MKYPIRKHPLEDLGKGTRGKHFKAYEAGTNFVLLSPDVAEASLNAEAANDALRMFIQIAGKTGRKQCSAAIFS